MKLHFMKKKVVISEIFTKIECFLKILIIELISFVISAIKMVTTLILDYQD